MPGSVANAVAVGVLPQVLATAFAEVREWPMQANEYVDGSSQRRRQAETSRKRYRITRALTADESDELEQFYRDHEGPLRAFYVYNPYERSGFSYDATGASTTGRHLMRFNGDYQLTLDMARSATQIELIELA
jgi:phage-related protein